MEQALDKYRIGLYEKAMPELSWKEKLCTAAECGYDYVEMSIDASEEKIARIYMTKAETDELLRLTKETGVGIESFCVSALTKFSLGNPDPAKAERGVEIGIGSVKLAHALGIRTVMIPGYDVYYEPHTNESEELFVSNLRRVVQAAEIYGVTLGFETMENDFMNTTAKAMKYVELINSVYLQVYPDTGNMKNGSLLTGVPDYEDLKTGRGHITALHLKESKPGIFREVPYGEGHVDFEKMIQTAVSLGVRRFVTEFWYKGSENWLEDIKSANRLMRGYIEKYI